VPPSTSFPVALKFTLSGAEPLLYETLAAVTVGGSLTGVTVIETVATALSSAPSLTLKVKLSVPP
jgi:hypothetical protein